MDYNEEIKKLEVRRCMAILDGNWAGERRISREIQALRERQTENEWTVLNLIQQLWPGALIVL